MEGSAVGPVTKGFALAAPACVALIAVGWSMRGEAFLTPRDGVGYALDEFNAALITPEMQEAVDAAKASIIAGDTEVVAYYTNDSCPVLEF